MMKDKLRQVRQKFHVDESGAVTVEWIVLTAATVGLALAGTYPVFQGSNNVSDTLSDHLTTTVDAIAD